MHLSAIFLALNAKSVAQILCKACKNVEEGEVSYAPTRVFHKLINTCVENFAVAKYFLRNSALALQCGALTEAKCR
jgi:hypothetical protein